MMVMLYNVSVIFVSLARAGTYGAVLSLVCENSELLSLKILIFKSWRWKLPSVAIDAFGAPRVFLLANKFI